MTVTDICGTAAPVGMDICTVAPVGTVTAVAGGTVAGMAMVAPVGDGHPVAGFGFAAVTEFSRPKGAGVASPYQRGRSTCCGPFWIFDPRRLSYVGL